MYIYVCHIYVCVCHIYVCIYVYILSYNLYLVPSVHICVCLCGMHVVYMHVCTLIHIRRPEEDIGCPDQSLSTIERKPLIAPGGRLVFRKSPSYPFQLSAEVVGGCFASPFCNAGSGICS